MEKIIRKKLDILVDSFQTILYEKDDAFLENMKDKNIAGDDIRCYMYWEWTQGVGLYGIWKLFEKIHEQKYIDIIEKYFELSFDIGLPAKNVNTVTPLLTLAKYLEYKNNEKYEQVCEDWASYICNSMAKTDFGGIQHQTSDSINKQELWDDTLFMSVLFLANWGKFTNNQRYMDEANYQFLMHAYFLSDNKTGLWYHGWTFDGNNNFVDAFWGRGNCWITAAIPEFLSLNISSNSEKRFLRMLLNRQIDKLIEFQDNDGMWHTLIDDKTSYLESSATCGIVYGILLATKLNLIDKKYLNQIERSVESILLNIDSNGVLQQVSYGTPMGRKSKSFYKNIPLKSMPYGQALAMLALGEKLNK